MERAEVQGCIARTEFCCRRLLLRYCAYNIIDDIMGDIIAVPTSIRFACSLKHLPFQTPRPHAETMSARPVDELLHDHTIVLSNLPVHLHIDNQTRLDLAVSS